ncbi:Protein phosphatase 1 regulatory subunit 3B [Varanus komodoensis]|uniref:Protein phosphatase 1 regulatory subunit n=1 Tax=Varanus komodoensis TaxID=61221 RepID=A0A8D2JCH4_VARKO|nr:protein phosphatase 1 regulatory subunit 3B isoform X1 [Varanus komodoensis]XP_044274854.1 protein phosphatase 1 regulatory subunit 3B isoform X1 [Varanus komodoensis]XP_044274855.1 protein phosphatase 1 regulatory subunit 3B isoform X1 [Varanus komodoensis]XP_044274856.1 protein phosphatase 1 regulatory subunit 3B isoform X1 [Varanus komodoensis]KAF7236469.1 Protein phosphatase 1 regulatory subunit 3B [Varanus komodoensis]
MLKTEVRFPSSNFWVSGILDSFPHKPTMAVDVAMQLCLRTAPLRRESFACKIAPKPKKPLRPCIHLNSSSELNEREAEIKALQKKAKKKVSFADSRGLALTVVKVFSEFDNPHDIPFNITELIDNIVGLTTVERDDFVLDFVQPSADYLDFRNRLQADYVCLENCTLKDKAIMGTVKVRNLAFEKAVKIRMTFDTWKTFTDCPCQYVKDTYAGSDKDTFSFEISLPERVQPHERIEFAVCYECDGRVYWDSNNGQNYRIIRSELKSAREISQPQDEPGFGIAFDQFGSPRCSYGLFPEWPSYSGYEKLGPYY